MNLTGKLAEYHSTMRAMMHYDMRAAIAMEYENWGTPYLRVKVITRRYRHGYRY